MRRTILYRAGAAAFLLALAAVMLVIGRGHMVYLDNKTMEYGGETYSAPYRIDVYVDGERAARLGARERGESVCVGQTFRVTLEVTEEKKGEPYTRELSVKIPYGLDGVILNLPGLLADLPVEACLTEFIPAPVTEEPEDGPSGEDTLPGEDGLTDGLSEELVPGDL